MRDGEVPRGTFAVFFNDRDRLDWWDILTRPGFRHCWAAFEDPNGTTVAIEFTEGCTIVTATTEPIDSIIEGQRKLGVFNQCVVIDANTLDNAPRACITIIPPGCVLSCVSIVKSFLGVYWPGAITPYGIYRQLVRAGGTVHGRTVQET